jgi:hypothetical protein
MSATKEPHFFAAEVRRKISIPSSAARSPATRHLTAQVPRLSSIGWLKGSGFWKAAARITPPVVRPLIRHTLTRREGTTLMDPADRLYLRDFYREDIRKLEGLVGRSWLR